MDSRREIFRWLWNSTYICHHFSTQLIITHTSEPQTRTLIVYWGATYINRNIRQSMDNNSLYTSTGHIQNMCINGVGEWIESDREDLSKVYNNEIGAIPCVSTCCIIEHGEYNTKYTWDIYGYSKGNSNPFKAPFWSYFIVNLVNDIRESNKSKLLSVFGENNGNDDLEFYEYEDKTVFKVWYIHHRDCTELIMSTWHGGTFFTDI